MKLYLILLILTIVAICSNGMKIKRQQKPAVKSQSQASASPFVLSLRYLNRGIEPPPTDFLASRLSVTIDHIDQKLDHYDENSMTWKMRYMSNGEFHKDGGPMFIFVGGEAEIHDGFLLGGVMYDMAKEHNGYMFTTEHRYYGKSVPTPDLSLENIKYLASHQALADLAHFIRTQKQKPHFANSKVILVSGSYPGALTVWAQHLYPDLIDGSWASSAPLNAKVEFPEYKEVVGEAIRVLGGDACYNRFFYAINKLEEYVNTRQTDELKRVMRICDNFNVDNWLDVGALFSSISNVVAGLVQNHNPGDIERECKQIMSSVDDVTGVADWYNSKLGGSGCFDYTFGASVGHMKNTEISDSMWRQWTYQLCREFGYSQTSKSQHQPFGTKFPVQFYENVCLDVFGITRDQFYANIEITNNYYGGLNPNVKNVYYSHGGIDPWHPAGKLQNDDGTSSIIPYFAHCKDFNSISDGDSSALKASKEKLMSYVRRWLA